MVNRKKENVVQRRILHILAQHGSTFVQKRKASRATEAAHHTTTSPGSTNGPLPQTCQAVKNSNILRSPTFRESACPTLMSTASLRWTPQSWMQCATVLPGRLPKN